MATRLRPVHIAPIDAVVRTGADGALYMQSPQPLGAYPSRITERLDWWAAQRAGAAVPGPARRRRRHGGP